MASLNRSIIITVSVLCTKIPTSVINTLAVRLLHPIPCCHIVRKCIPPVYNLYIIHGTIEQDMAVRQMLISYGMCLRGPPHMKIVFMGTVT